MISTLSSIKVLVTMSLVTASTGLGGLALEAIPDQNLNDFAHISATDALSIIATFLGAIGTFVAIILSIVIQAQNIYINCKKEKREQIEFNKPK